MCELYPLAIYNLQELKNQAINTLQVSSNSSTDITFIENGPVIF